MFNKDGKLSKDALDTLISPKTEIIGDVKFKGALVVEGIVKGNLIAEAGSGALVRIADSGRVEGEIQAPNVVVNGEIIGNIHAGEFIELAKKARVKGDVHYHSMEMVMGSQVNGKLIHSAKEHAGKKGLKQTASAPVADQTGDKVD